MSMRFSNPDRTICEVFREINDMHQGKDEHDETIRKKLLECEQMAKRMAHKLYAYSKEWDKEWWDKNQDHEKNVLKRLNQSYLTAEEPIEKGDGK